MRVHLTNYIGVTATGIPIINAPLDKNKFGFNIEHTTPEFQIKANVAIDAANNSLLFTNYTNGELPAIDEYLVKQAFEDYSPHIEIYCASKKCGIGYHVAGQWMKLTKTISVKGAWVIDPFGMFVEAVKIKNYVVHNDHQDKMTWIYSRINPHAEPIVVPLVDFSTMDKNKLITRIQTIVTFS
jgi:hypothetical protein